LTITPEKKYCPRCTQEKPFAAFRKAKRAGHNCPDNANICVGCLDSYCKACRRADTQANRPRENARWQRYRKSSDIDKKKDPVKVRARQAALRAHEKPKSCSVKGCAKRAHRHHYRGYEGDAAKDIQWLCPSHHALEHVLEKARTRLGPAYMGKSTNIPDKSKFVIGDRPQVRSVHTVERKNPAMNVYIGQRGTVEMILPSEWGLPCMYRLVFTNGLPPMAFMGRELW
jgi:hypothetical protein